jgi:cytochrome c oxidase subunit 4
MASHTNSKHEGGGHGGHHDEGAVHAHISSVPFYIFIFVALLVFTVITVGQSYVDLGKLNLLVVIIIATCKASLVVSFFMHLKHDNRFNALMFVSGLLFIGVFFTYTMNDTERRGEIEETSAVWVLPKTGEHAPGGLDLKGQEERRAKMVKEHGHGAGAGAHEAPHGDHHPAPGVTTEQH